MPEFCKWLEAVLGELLLRPEGCPGDVQAGRPRTAGPVRVGKVSSSTGDA